MNDLDTLVLLVNMFCACTTSDTILQHFCKPKSVLRVIVATIAFGLGLMFIE